MNLSRLLFDLMTIERQYFYAIEWEAKFVDLSIHYEMNEHNVFHFWWNARMENKQSLYKRTTDHG